MWMILHTDAGIEFELFLPSKKLTETISSVSTNNPAALILYNDAYGRIACVCTIVNRLIFIFKWQRGLVFSKEVIAKVIFVICC